MYAFPLSHGSLLGDQRRLDPQKERVLYCQSDSRSEIRMVR